MKKTFVDKDACIECALCYTDYDSIYEVAGDGKAQAGPDNSKILDTPDLEKTAEEAKENCPSDAIIIEEA